MTDADSEQLETQHWIGVALDSKYITEAEAKAFKERCITISKMLFGVMAKADSFCRRS
jgi:four helix bundle protein